jgi:hypothetical protein
MDDVLSGVNGSLECHSPTSTIVYHQAVYFGISGKNLRVRVQLIGDEITTSISDRCRARCRDSILKRMIGLNYRSSWAGRVKKKS